ncbi:MAG TPA: thymidine phosphorylase [Gaiellaceae bacterium]|nr:thymidine phosphorylase [Gaiellaceae bacterium]
MIPAAELIQRKRDGEELSAEEISDLVLAYARDELPDYQMAAFCMAVYFEGLTPAETHALTDAMVASGETIDLSALGRKVVDKHSTGGVGDKTSIALGPVVAACGVPFAKMSGRGLGHTGGTLDKLESVPGFSIELDGESFVRQVREIGLAIVGQTADLVPADRKLYALRDVTATVDIIPLIASSIMSKKIAGGADAIVLDVKVGDGAFMKTFDDARELARAMVELGRMAGREVVCELTDMDQPLGRAVGNSLEIAEVLDTLEGDGPPDLVELVLGAAGHLLELSDLGVDAAEGRRRAEEAIESGAARERYERWVRAQGGDPAREALPTAPAVSLVPAAASGYVQAIATTSVGLAALHLGAGRVRKEDSIDHAVGIVCLAKRGDRVETGQAIAEVHARDEGAAARAAEEITACYRIGDEEPEPRPIVLDVFS